MSTPPRRTPEPCGPDLSRTVGESSEEEILALIFPLLPAGDSTLVGPGDDAAVVAATDGRVVVSTDVLVEDRHFRRDWSTGYDVGWRAAVQNLADVAAMGARPTALVVSLVMPRDLPVAWVTGLARGLADACAPTGTGVVGGDLSSGSEVVVAVTVHGDLQGRDPVLRSGARPGDVVAHAGVRGWSAAGLATIGAGLGSQGEPLAAQDRATAGYLRPDPPLAAGVDAAVAGATAMLDVSDGLLRDAGRVARASGVVLDLQLDAFEDDARRLADVARGLVEALGTGPAGEAADDETWRRYVGSWVLTGGEDHGLLATFPPGVELPAPFRAVGTVLDTGARTSSGSLVTVDGAEPPVAGSGWDHFGA